MTRPDGVQDLTYLGNQLRTLTKGGLTQKHWYDSEGSLDCVTTDTVDQTACNTPAGEPVSTQVFADYSYDYLNRLKGLKTYTLAGGASTADKDTSYEDDALGRNSKQTEKHGVLEDREESVFDRLRPQLARRQLGALRGRKQGSRSFRPRRAGTVAARIEPTCLSKRARQVSRPEFGASV